MLQQTLSRIAALAIFLASTAAWAGSLTTPNSFVANTPAKAAEVNENFSAVETAVNSKQDKLIIVCSDEANFISTLSTTTIDLESVTITVPGPGTVYVTGSGMVRLSGDLYDGSPFHVMFSLTDATAIDNFDASNFWGSFRGGLPAGTSFDSPFHEHKDFAVTVAGSFSYFLTSSLLVVPTAGLLQAGKSKLCAQFIPD